MDYKYKYIKYKSKYFGLSDNNSDISINKTKYININNNQSGGTNNLIIHISGAQGSGKTTLGDKLKHIFGNKIYMKDLDHLFGEFTKQSKIKDYQKYIDKFIKSHSDKPIILVGLDADLCLGPINNPKLKGYNIPAKHKYYINIDLEDNLRQWFFRQVDKLNDRQEWFWQEYKKDNQKIQDKLFRYVDLNGRKENSTECKKLYLSKNYKLLNRDIILDKCEKLILDYLEPIVPDSNHKMDDCS